MDRQLMSRPCQIGASSHASFQETQRPRQWWLWVVLGTVATLLAWACFWLQIVVGQSIGDSPAPDWVVLLFWGLFGLAAPVLFWICHLTTHVGEEALTVTYFPFLRRRIAYAELASCQAITYYPLKIYGGWGIRVNMDGSWVYSVSGNQGVQLVFRNGRRLLIGSLRAKALAHAIEAQRTSRNS